MSEFEKGACLVMHNAYITDAILNITGGTTFELYFPNTSFSKNFISNSFVGCCMAARRDFLLPLLPFPKNTPMHDWLIALCAIRQKKNIALIDTPLMLWRRHGGNVTGKKIPLGQKIRWRIDILKGLIRCLS